MSIFTVTLLFLIILSVYISIEYSIIKKVKIDNTFVSAKLKASIEAEGLQLKKSEIDKKIITLEHQTQSKFDQIKIELLKIQHSLDVIFSSK